MCCTNPGQPVDFDSSQGLPAGCALFSDIGIDADGDGEFDSATDMCPPSQANRHVLETMVSRRVLPDLPSTTMGQRIELSKGDVAAADAMFWGDHASRGYNSLSEYALGIWATRASQHRVGDVNGDGMDDLVAIYQGDGSDFQDGSVYVAFGREDGSFEVYGRWHDEFCLDGTTCELGDVDGDGDDDLVSFEWGNGDVLVAFASGDGFYNVLDYKWHETLGQDGTKFLLADVDGDCRDDVVVLKSVTTPWPSYTTNLFVTVAFSEPGRFQVTMSTRQFVGRNKATVGDIDADGDADLLVWKFGDYPRLHDWEGDGWQLVGRGAGGKCYSGCYLSDMTGDGRADLVELTNTSSVGHHLDRVVIRPSTGWNFTGGGSSVYHEMDCRGSDGCLFGDVDGDGLTDLIDTVDADDLSIAEKGRKTGVVFVSRSTGIWTDYSGGKKPIDPFWFASTCQDLPDMGL
jgi:hypothetical protein